MASKQLLSFGSRAVRQFSSSAASSQLVKAPIQLHGVEGRYAHALYSAASKSGCLEATETELVGIQEKLKTDAALNQFFNDPSIKKKVKVDAIGSTMASLGVSAITTNLIGALAENSRLGRANGIINAYSKIMSAHRGEVSCSITTAKTLDKKTMKTLMASLQKFVGEGKTLLVTSTIDPALLGGMVVNVDEYFIDLSIASKIKKISQSLQYSA